MITAPDPDIPLRDVISLAHRLVIWLSLDSLNPYWQTLPPVAPDPAPIRAAAQAALHGWHASSGADAPESWFFASLAANGLMGSEAAMRNFIAARERMETSANLGYGNPGYRKTSIAHMCRAWTPPLPMPMP